MPVSLLPTDTPQDGKLLDAAAMVRKKSLKTQTPWPPYPKPNS